MNILYQDTYYFNTLKTENINNNLFNILNNNEWYIKNIVLYYQVYKVYLTIYDNKIYIKPIINYNTTIFKNIFHFNILKWFNTDKIVEIIEYS